jgi:hypothetical protein
MTGQNINLRKRALLKTGIYHYDPMKYKGASCQSWKYEIEKH